jgi:hypothetical protein
MAKLILDNISEGGLKMKRCLCGRDYEGENCPVCNNPECQPYLHELPEGSQLQLLSVKNRQFFPS